MSYPIAPALSRTDIEKMTQIIRKRTNCTSCYLEIVSFIEFVIPKIDPEFDYEYVDDHMLPSGMYAYYDPYENKMTIRNSVYEGACDNNGRDRFTLAHETGHYFLHRNGLSFARSEYEVPKYCDPEWQANVFASALLIPKSVTFSMGAEEIRDTCKVSYQAAEIASRRNRQ